MTLKQWHSDEANRHELETLLEHPTLKKALELTERSIRPTAIAPADPSTNLIQWQAILGSRREGASDALNFLRSLTLAPAPPREQHQEWALKPISD